jgi:hypothetical protein
MALLRKPMSAKASSLLALLVLSLITGYSAWHYFKPAEPVKKIGPYSFLLPKGYKIVKDKGIDSYVGRITNDTITIYFDYGYYSDPLLLTQEEYVHSYQWRLNAAAEIAAEDLKFEETEQDVKSSTLPDLQVRTIRYDTLSNEWLATCVLDSIELNYRIPIPMIYKEYETIEADSTESDYIKVVIPFDAQKNYTGMYLRDKKYNGAALSLVAHKLTELQKKEVLRILHEVKRIDD